jgi:hypothetical protein
VDYCAFGSAGQYIFARSRKINNGDSIILLLGLASLMLRVGLELSILSKLAFLANCMIMLERSPFDPAIANPAMERAVGRIADSRGGIAVWAAAIDGWSNGEGVEGVARAMPDRAASVDGGRLEVHQDAVMATNRACELKHPVWAVNVCREFNVEVGERDGWHGLSVLWSRLFVHPWYSYSGDGVD